MLAAWSGNLQLQSTGEPGLTVNNSGFGPPCPVSWPDQRIKICSDHGSGALPALTHEPSLAISGRLDQALRAASRPEGAVPTLPEAGRRNHARRCPRDSKAVVGPPRLSRPQQAHTEDTFPFVERWACGKRSVFHYGWPCKPCWSAVQPYQRPASQGNESSSRRLTETSKWLCTLRQADDRRSCRREYNILDVARTHQAHTL